MFDPAKNLRPLLGIWPLLCRRYVLCEMSLFISTFVHVVPPMFDTAYYWGPYLGLWGSPAAGGLRQTSISDCGRLHYICSCTQMLVPCSFDQNALAAGLIYTF